MAEVVAETRKNDGWVVGRNKNFNDDGEAETR
jgi:hypothetical protein